MRRLTLVLGILHDPKALILDEPTVGLDPQTRLQILDRIREIADNGTAVLFSTHYLDEAERLCDRIGIINEGKIIEEGTLHELRAKIEDVQIIHLRGPFDRKPLETFVDTVDGAGRVSGRTPHFRIVHFDGDAGLLGRTLEVEVTGSGPNALTGRLAQANH